MKWWVIVRVRSRFEGEAPELLPQREQLQILRDMIAKDVQPFFYRGIEAGNMWFTERVGHEWERGHWKWTSEKAAPTCYCVDK